MRYRLGFDDPRIRAFDLVRPVRALHRLARWLGALIVLFAAALAFVPWQQTVRGQGQVLALSPTERPQSIDAPVAGWLSEWFVMEGAHVAAGDPIVRIVDNDPDLLVRLERERDAARARMQAAEAAVRAGRTRVRRQEALRREGLASQRQIEEEQFKLADALQALASARSELARAEVALTRQSQQLVIAPRAGVIVRREAGVGSVYVRQGDPLAHLVPDTESRAVELWISGNDLPFVSTGREVRLQFEGLPALQITGWPGVAVGTFGGVVSFIDAAGVAQPGSFRILVTSADERWPSTEILRQGVRAQGWVLLDTVPLGFELWRRFNAFPPHMPEPMRLRTPGEPPDESGPRSPR